MASYKAKVWDGSQWVDIAAQPTDLSSYALQESVDDLIDPYFLMGA